MVDRMQDNHAVIGRTLFSKDTGTSLVPFLVLKVAFFPTHPSPTVLVWLGWRVYIAHVYANLLPAVLIMPLASSQLVSPTNQYVDWGGVVFGSPPPHTHTHTSNGVCLCRQPQCSTSLSAWESHCLPGSTAPFKVPLAKLGSSK